MRSTGLAVAVLCLAACSSDVPAPATLDTRNDACASCRMAVSDARFASQVVVPGELPRFFDDLGCLAEWLKQHPPAEGSTIFVADHRTKSWVPAAAAVYTRVDGLETPMGSHLVAHADERSREQDELARVGDRVTAVSLFGSAVSSAR